MTKNQLRFMLRTGKYLPEENIQSFCELYYFEHLDSNGNRIYYEDSEFFWYKQKYDKDNKCIYYEDVITVRGNNKHGNYIV